MNSHNSSKDKYSAWLSILSYGLIILVIVFLGIFACIQYGIAKVLLGILIIIFIYRAWAMILYMGLCSLIVYLLYLIIHAIISYILSYGRLFFTNTLYILPYGQLFFANTL